MNQKNLISLIILDIVVIFFAAGLMVLRYRSLTNYALTPLYDLSKAQKPDAKPQAQDAAHQDAAKPEAKPATGKGIRNIGFTYKNSKAKRVEIIGSFNNWVPQPLKQAEKSTWKISLALPPGDYAYNFVVNGKPVRDPFNSKICNAGRGFPNSYLKVKPINEE